ncbi:tyrosine-type recombinase/integrase [Burkholderia gladioli]|uniref:tyrosine-type recombinase/integrase n=1 Tax=Burkholderia gladioli TaxID=28095 RepID=UPI00163FBB76|nr:integrase family protein [Burkholderia gladioli]
MTDDQPAALATARNAPKGKIPFTDKTLRLIFALPFEQRPVGIAEDGSIVTEPVPSTMTDYFVKDATLPGFNLRIQRSGTRSFVAEKKLGARPCRFKCGEYPSTSLTDARAKAKAALNIIATGRDPNLEVRAAKQATEKKQIVQRLTFYRMMQRDAERRADGAEGKRDTFNTARDRKNTLKVVKRYPIATMPIGEVRAAHLDQMITTIRQKHPTTAIKVWRYARAAWGRLAADEAPEINPFDEFLKVHDTSLPRPNRVTRVLPINEQSGQGWLERIAAQRFPETALKTGHPWTRGVMADYIICTLCWGARKMEGMALKWTDIDFDRKVVTFYSTKNKTDHLFPLTPGVEAILRRRQALNAQPRGRDRDLAKKGAIIPMSEYVFPTERRTAKSGHITSVDSLMRYASNEGEVRCTLHDLRRTMAGEVALDVLGGDKTGRGDFRLLKLALNHSEGNRDITTTYMIAHKLEVLTPLYEAHERKILGIAGIPIPEKVRTVDEVDQEVAQAMEHVGKLAAQDPIARARAAAQLKALMDSLNIIDEPIDED